MTISCLFLKNFNKWNQKNKFYLKIITFLKKMKVLKKSNKISKS